MNYHWTWKLLSGHYQPTTCSTKSSEEYTDRTHKQKFKI